MDLVIAAARGDTILPTTLFPAVEIGCCQEGTGLGEEGGGGIEHQKRVEPLSSSAIIARRSARTLVSGFWRVHSHHLTG